MPNYYSYRDMDKKGHFVSFCGCFYVKVMERVICKWHSKKPLKRFIDTASSLYVAKFICVFCHCFVHGNKVSLRLTHQSLDKMASIQRHRFHMHFHAQRVVFWINLLTLFLHWCRQWLDAEQATNHYLYQYWHFSLTHICDTRERWVQSRIRCGGLTNCIA